MDNRVQAVMDKQSNRITGRLSQGVDLFEGIREACQRFNIEAAQFNCIGSLAYATYVQLEKTNAGILQYSPKIISDTEVELLSGTGFVGVDLDGEMDIHFHGMFVDCKQQISGGHFIKGENPVAITIEYILLPLEGVELKRGPDSYSNLPVFQFSEKE